MTDGESKQLVPDNIRAGAEPRIEASTDDADRPNPRGSVVDRLRGTYVKVLSTSWLFSLILHIVALLVIGKIFLPMLPAPPVRELVVGEAVEPPESLEQFQEMTIDTEVSDMDFSESTLPTEPQLEIVEPELTLPTETPMLASVEPVMTMADTISDIAAPSIGNPKAAAISGRTGMAASALRHAGGNAASEAAVNDALRWLADHQLPSGGWSLQHNRVQGCNCQNPGFKQEGDQPARPYKADFGATGLALLPFLGSGRTHVKGEYQQVVRRGLGFLVTNMKQDGARGALKDAGSYYSHGICTIAVCEAYAMTKDDSLRGPAQALVNEIIYAQDPVGGGWRYKPKQPGDTSVTGWQFMALKSANMAGLRVPSNVIQGANKFLNDASFYDAAYAAKDCVVAAVSEDSVLVNIPPEYKKDKSIKRPAYRAKYTGVDTSKADLKPGQPLPQGTLIGPYAADKTDLIGWRYRYTVIPEPSHNEIDPATNTVTVKPAHPTPTLTAVGILCRMYSGMEEDDEILQRTINYLSKLGPSISSESTPKGPNMYYNYYATQVLRHQSSPDQWSEWNEELRDFLIESQDRNGHERGSWYFGDGAHGSTGGRLYATALASMILEVYYRHLPLYQKQVASSFLD